MIINKFTTFLNESKDNKRVNDLLKKLGVMDNAGDINLKDMIDKINDFLDKDGNKEKFLKNYDDHIKDGDMVKSKNFKVKDLKPSQKEIFLDHVLSRLVVNDDDRKQIIKGKLKDNNILVSSDGHIIDGHHRWASAYILNPECELDCTEIDMSIEIALPIINAMIEVSDKGTKKIKEYKINIFKIKDWGKQKTWKKMNSIIEKSIMDGIDLGDEVKKSKKSWETKDELKDINTTIASKFYKKLKKKLKLDKHPLKLMRKNMRKIDKPLDLFSGREDMPKIKKKDAKELL